jgi:hypothetical protein
MSRRRREPVSLRREFVRELLWIGIVLAAFLAFMWLEIPRVFGEWFAHSFMPGR